MLITKMKSKEELLSLAKDRVLMVVCKGCQQAYLPMEDIAGFREELKKNNIDFIELESDYLCNHDFTKARIEKWAGGINEAGTVMIFSCGVGVQVISSHLSKPVISCLDTFFVRGFKGLNPTEPDCGQCGDCFLNYTDGICPITACTKSLLNGPCGGAKNGKCEIDTGKECGWEKIYKKLDKNSKLEMLKLYQNPRNYKL